MKHPTIYDVAEKAGVSANTVSRVINGKSGVGDRTRTRIRKIIQEIGYHPNVGARALRGGRPACIGVIQSANTTEIPMSHPFVQWLFAEMYRVFGNRGERICFDMNPCATGGDDYARSIWENLFSACVFVSPLRVDDTVIERVHRSGIPYLSLGRLDRFPQCSSATADYEQGAYLSTRYLLERGHRHIAMLRAFESYQPGVDRMRGYLRALEEAGIEPDNRLVQSVGFASLDNATIVHRLLVDERVTALVDCSATEDAWSIREGARRAGRVCGTDFEVVVWTYNNDTVVLPEASAHLWVPVREAAAEGLEQLAEWHHGERNEPINLQYAPALFETPPDELITPSRRLFGLVGGN